MTYLTLLGTGTWAGGALRIRGRSVRLFSIKAGATVELDPERDADVIASAQRAIASGHRALLLTDAPPPLEQRNPTRDSYAQHLRTGASDGGFYVKVPEPTDAPSADAATTDDWAIPLDYPCPLCDHAPFPTTGSRNYHFKHRHPELYVPPR